MRNQETSASLGQADETRHLVEFLVSFLLYLPIGAALGLNVAFSSSI